LDDGRDSWVFFLNRLQLFILQHYGGLATVGIFNLSIQLSSIISIIAVSFGNAWQPLVYSAVNRESAANIIARTAKYFTAGMLLFSLVLFLLSEEILMIIGRQAYASAKPVLQLAVMGTFLYVLSNLPATVLLYQYRARLSQLIVSVCAALNLPLSIVLIQAWGVHGAAWAMLFSFALLLTGRHLVAQRVMPVNYPWCDLLKIICIGIVILVVETVLISPLIPMPYSTIFRIMLLVGYLVGVYITGIFSLQEFESVRLTASNYLKKLGFYK